MSDEFLRVARQEIQSEIDSLEDIFLGCTNDEQLYEKSRDVEKHMHKIKGLAPMMGQEKVGEIARISDIILKHKSRRIEVLV
jgi:chemotaxis protein histidine kinase CheA